MSGGGAVADADEHGLGGDSHRGCGSDDDAAQACAARSTSPHVRCVVPTHILKWLNRPVSAKVPSAGSLDGSTEAGSETACGIGEDVTLDFSTPSPPSLMVGNDANRITSSFDVELLHASEFDMLAPLSGFPEPGAGRLPAVRLQVAADGALCAFDPPLCSICMQLQREREARASVTFTDQVVNVVKLKDGEAPPSAGTSSGNLVPGSSAAEAPPSTVSTGRPRRATRGTRTRSSGASTAITTSSSKTPMDVLLKAFQSGFIGNDLSLYELYSAGNLLDNHKPFYEQQVGCHLVSAFV